MYGLLIIVAVAIAGANAQGGWAAAETPPTQGYIWITSLPECEGKDAGNYTRVTTDVSALNCDSHSQDAAGPIFLIANPEPHGPKQIISLQPLASSGNLPAGADVVFDQICLAIGGPLDGRYVYYRVKHLNRDYLKKCSSVLGISAIVSKYAELLISEKLSPQVLINPNGAYEEFKKGCTTVCKGQEIGV